MTAEQLEEIRARHARWDNSVRMSTDDVGDLLSHVNAIGAENKRLREALSALLGDVTHDDGRIVAITTTHTTLTRARKALKEET